MALESDSGSSRSKLTDSRELGRRPGGPVSKRAQTWLVARLGATAVDPDHNGLPRWA